MATTADFRNGLCIEFNGNLWIIVQFQHVKPGKGPAFVRTKIKNLKTGKVLDNTFTAGVKINEVRVERRSYQFLYKDGTGYHFMNNKDFEQIPVQKEVINAPKFLKEGDNVEILFHAEEEIALTCELPTHVVLEIIHTEPGVKGDTATNALKEATVETGVTVKVPLFINIGDKIKIDTRTGGYEERVRE